MLKIYNSLTRDKAEFSPVRPGEVSMYVCGPTVYDESHIGHARSAYVFDCVRRYLKYKGYSVKFVKNITDIDDKIIDKARSEGRKGDLKAAVKEISEKYLEAYHHDMESLGIEGPDHEPRATEYIPKMILFIEELIAKGGAYVAGEDVYFDVRAFRGYGALSNQSIDKMEAGARVSPGEKKRDPLDFALWKGSKPDEPSWPSPWGEGRPGWHIECSVMSTDILGGEFDIHGGGIDLIFPHHENEVAQAKGCGRPFARIWMHNGLLTINGEKMAKSLGNFISIKGFLDRYRDPDILKLVFLTSHYRNPLDYTEEKISQAKKEKERVLILLEKLDGISKGAPGARPPHPPDEADRLKKKFEEAMDDDFNAPLAVGRLFELVTHVNKAIDSGGLAGADGAAKSAEYKGLLLELCGLLGLNIGKGPVGEGAEAWIEELVERRNRVRKKGDFRLADQIRRDLLEKGVILEDTKEGTKWRRRI